ncbi:CHAT domain-containing protein [Streptomyces sp. NPDC058000]|uniref:CHAT domain-containing protein n=1 Tax=Streptomyces sp. NPDC058000 TaxID=3346299 RepID=UPI0036E99EBD
MTPPPAPTPPEPAPGTATSAPPDPTPGTGPLPLLDLAEQLLEHHDAQERPEEAGRAWNRCRAVLHGARDALEAQGAAADPDALARARYLLGLTLSVGYWQATGGRADAYGIDDTWTLREDAARLLALSRATLPDDAPAYPTACLRLGLLLHDRHEAPGQDAASPAHTAHHDDLDEALAAFQEGLPLLDEAPHPGVFVTYACALADRYDRDRVADDLRDAAALLAELLDALRPPGRQPATDGAGSWADEADQLEIEARIRLIRLLQESPEPADAERAGHHLELLATTAPHDHPARIFASGHLIDAYQQRGGGSVRPDDEPAYVARLRDLHRLLDPDDPDHARATVMLGGALVERQPPGRTPPPELHEAVDLLRTALTRLPPDDALSPPGHALLGSVLSFLQEHQPERYDLTEARHHLERALDGYPADDPMRGNLLHHLAHATLVDDRATPDLDGIDRTLALLNESMRMPSPTPGFGSQAHGAYAAALSQRHALSHSADDLGASLRHLTAAFRQTPADDPNRIVYLQNLAVGLYQRYLAGGDLQDLHTAHHYLNEVNAVLAGGTVAPDVRHLVERDRPHLEHGLAQLQFALAFNSRNAQAMTAAIAVQRRVRDALAPDDPWRLPFEADYGLMLLVYSFFGGTPRDRIDGLLLMVEAVESLPTEDPHRPRLLLRTAGALLMTSATPYRARGIAAAEKMLQDTLAAVVPESQEGLRASALYALLLHHRFRHTGAPGDADRAVEVAQAARDRIRTRAPSPVSTLLGNVLADALRARSAPGDAAAARRTGIAALQEAATVVLLQAAAEPALQMARTAADRALQIARWCLADGDLPGAVEALELGRGQVLHASITTADVPALLRAAGRADLADEWEGRAGRRRAPATPDLGALLGGEGALLGTLAEGAEPPLPDDLRHRALTALAQSDAGTALTTAPTPDAIAATLRAADARALVYLLPPGGAGSLSAEVAGSGAAVILTDDGRLDTLDLGLLRPQGLQHLHTYREAHRHRQNALAQLPHDDPEHQVAHARWQAALQELCDWAGPTVMGPLTRAPLIRAAGPEPHLVLVPFGELGGIPWHAALLSSGLRHGGRPVRAVERLTLSYAASARQLQEVLGRPRLPLHTAPAIVGNPDDSLPGAASEARQIHAALYPQGLLLGKVRGADGPGTPTDILAALPGRERAGASVLHLACHAFPSASSPLDAHLALAPDGAGGKEDAGHLSVREILHQAQGRPPGAPGGLVILDACVSDHTAGDFDEALTLSTAFLAAGATGVIGSRWEVPDGQTGLLMYVLHDHLRGGATPVRALRQAQLWLLDPARRIPPDMPRRVADILDDGDPAALELWAAFACQGQ